MYKNLLTGVLALFLIFIFFAVPIFAAPKEDQCEREGIVVRNATMLDLWYKRNGGDCRIWVDEHLFVIKSEDSIDIYSDMNCKTLYCAKNPKYKDYKSFDTDGDCRVKILPHCKVSDM